MLTGYDAEANAASSPNVTNPRWNSVERVVLKTVAATIRTEEAMTISWKVTRHLSWTLAIFGSGVDPECRLGGNVIQGVIERHGRHAEGT